MDDPPRSDFIYVAFLLLMAFVGGMVFGSMVEQRRQESIEQRLEVLESQQ